MSDDREFKIKISADASTVSSEAQKAGSALGDLEQKSKQFTADDVEGSSKIVAGKHDIRAALSVLGSQLGEFGGLARFAFSPMAVAMGGILYLIRGVHAANESLKASLLALSTPMGDIAGAMREVRLEAIRSDEAFHRFTESASRDARIKIEGIRAEQKATEELSQAREKYELSQAKTPEQREQIQARYASSRASSAAGFDQREINAKQTELDNLRLAKREAAAAASHNAPGMTRAQVEAHEKDNSRLIADLDRQMAEISKTAEEQTPGWRDLALGGMSPWNYKDYQAQWALQESSQGMIARLRALRKRTVDRQEPLARASAAFKEQDQLGGMISDLAPQLGQERADATLSAHTAVLSGALNSGAEANENLGKIAEAIKASLDAGKGVSGAMLQELRAATQWQRQMEQRVRSLEGTRKTTAPGI